MKKFSDVYEARMRDAALTPDAAQQAVLPEFDRILKGLAARPQRAGLFGRRRTPVPVKGLYLWGGVGRGKSMLMDLFVAEVTVPKRRVHFHAFMQEVHAGMNAARARGVDDALAPVADAIAQEVRLLAFDEMQISDITDAMIVGRLFERLFDAGVVVVTTSNRAPDDLYKDGLNRALFLPFIARIKDNLEVWELSSPVDYRKGMLAGSRIYFAPADDEARVALDRMWQNLTGLAPDQGGAMTLQVKGRKVVLSRAHGGVARTGFADLCAKPLGAADYLAVADAVRVLIIEDVPSFSPAKANEAKRFVTLIDALYEAGVRVAISAATRPEDLFPEGTGSFEFARTVSRLHEMQGADWGS